MSADSVTVLVPVHGWAPFLAQTLDCILTQDPAPDEVVVIDDGSREPVRLSTEYARHCRLVRREQRGGPGAARASGFEGSANAIAAFCDADDAWEPGALAARLDALRSHPGAAVSFGRAVVVGPDDRPTGERWPEPRPGLHEASEFITELYHHNPIPVSSALVRREALDAAGGIYSGVAVIEDTDLWLRVASSGGDFVYSPEAVIRYRRHPGAMTANLREMAQAELDVHERHAQLVDEETVRRVRARDLTALARGLVRERRYGDAAAALAQAAALEPPGRRERLLRAAVRVPGARAALGRRDPYRSG